MTELIAPLPEVVLVPGSTITFEAIDPSTGAAVSGVKVNNVAIYCDTASGGGDTPAPPEEAAPLFVPLAVEEQ